MQAIGDLLIITRAEYRKNTNRIRSRGYAAGRRRERNDIQEEHDCLFTKIDQLTAALESVIQTSRKGLAETMMCLAAVKRVPKLVSERKQFN